MINVICLNCSKPFLKVASQCKKHSNHFCSRTCSATYNNKLYPKRKGKSKTKKCKYCDNLILANRQKCKDCIKNYRIIIDKDKLSEVVYKNVHKSSAFSLVRTRARAIAKTLGWNCCKHCGYDKHIEVAHIKPIKDFHEDTLICDINNVSNLLPLCPNCHFEFDNNLLTLEQINSSPSK